MPSGVRHVKPVTFLAETECSVLFIDEKEVKKYEAQMVKAAQGFREAVHKFPQDVSFGPEAPRQGIARTAVCRVGSAGAEAGGSPLPLFARASPDLTDRITRELKAEIFQAGEFIIRRNDAADCMFFIVSGVVEVTGREDEVHAEMTVGDFFGEVGIMLGLPRTASIRAKEECLLLKLTRSTLEEVTADHEEMLEHIKGVADRRRAAVDLRSARLRSEVELFDLEVGEQMLSK
ncbi:cyclic nucleotide-binding-like protein, partial [Blyttiomyces helicus]